MCDRLSCFKFSTRASLSGVVEHGFCYWLCASNVAHTLHVLVFNKVLGSTNASIIISSLCPCLLTVVTSLQESLKRLR